MPVFSYHCHFPVIFKCRRVRRICCSIFSVRSIFVWERMDWRTFIIIRFSIRSIGKIFDEVCQGKADVLSNRVSPDLATAPYIPVVNSPSDTSNFDVDDLEPSNKVSVTQLSFSDFIGSLLLRSEHEKGNLELIFLCVPVCVCGLSLLLLPA